LDLANNENGIIKAKGKVKRSGTKTPSTALWKGISEKSSDG